MSCLPPADSSAWRPPRTRHPRAAGRSCTRTAAGPALRAFSRAGAPPLGEAGGLLLLPADQVFVGALGRPPGLLVGGAALEREEEGLGLAPAPAGDRVQDGR